MNFVSFLTTTLITKDLSPDLDKLELTTLEHDENLIKKTEWFYANK